MDWQRHITAASGYLDLSQGRRTHLGAVLTTVAAFMLLGSITPAFAKRGGNGGGKPGSEVEVPFHYQITWHAADF